MAESSFSKKIFSNTTFAIFDQIAYKIGTVVAFIILVRLLQAESIAVIGIASGYMIVIGYLDISLVRVLLRDYPKIARDPEERNLHFTAYMLFVALQGAVMLLVALFMEAVILRPLGLPGLLFLYTALTFEFMALMFQDWIKLVFFTDLQQVFATKISALVTAVRLASYGLIFFAPSLDTYSWLLIVVSIGAMALWGFVFVRRFDFRPVFSRRIGDVLKHALGSYGIWDHLNRIAADTLFNVDTAILAYFTTLQVIGDYSIALKFTSLLLLLPRQLQRSLQVVLANYEVDRERFSAINTFFKANLLLSLAQLAGFVLFGKLLIRLMFGDVNIAGIYHYTIIISLGITVLSIAHPFMAVINNFTSLKRAFLWVSLPALVGGLAAFTAGSWLGGAEGMAWAKVGVFVGMALGMAFFARRYFHFPLHFEVISHEERRLLRELVRRPQETQR